MGVVTKPCRVDALNNWEVRWAMYKATFGRRFTEMLEVKGWDKKYASGVFQVSETMIANYMEGKNFPDVESFLRMCDTLDVSSDWLGGAIQRQIYPTERRRQKIIFAPSGKAVLRLI